MYNKITAIINLIWGLAIGAGIGLICYFFCWQSSWVLAGKIGAIVGFSLLGVIDLFLCCTSSFFAWGEDSYIDDKANIYLVVFLILLCGVVPGILFLIACIVNGREYNTFSSSSGGGYTYKPKAPDYNPDEDPAIIKKIKPNSNESGEDDQPKKKKLVYKSKH